MSRGHPLQATIRGHDEAQTRHREYRQLISATRLDCQETDRFFHSRPLQVSDDQGTLFTGTPGEFSFAR